MKKYSIELTEDQMRLIANSLEDVCRFAMGQVNLQNTIEAIVNNEQTKLDFDEQIYRRDLAKEKLEEVRKILFPEFPHKASLGYNGTDFIGNLYQIYKSILHRLAIDYNWSNVHSAEPLPSGNMGKVIVKEIKRTKK